MDSLMDSLPQPVSVTFRGMTHRGIYCIRGGELFVEAFGLGTRCADAAILEDRLDKAAENMAKLLLIEQLKESSTDPGLWTPVIDCGSTSRISYDQS